jgi:hypothetical protein
MEQFCHRPYVIRDSRRHPRRDSDAGMNAAKIVIGEVQGARKLQVVQLFRVGICQPGKAAKRHANRKVGAFHVAGADVARVGPSIPYPYYRLYLRPNS